MALDYTEIDSSLPDSSRALYDATDEVVRWVPGGSTGVDTLGRIQNDAVSLYDVPNGPCYDGVRIGDYVYLSPWLTTHWIGLIRIDPAKGYSVTDATGTWDGGEPAYAQAKGLSYDGSTYAWSNSESPAIGLIRWKISDLTYTKYPHSKNTGPAMIIGSDVWVAPFGRAYVCKFNTSGAFVTEYAISNHVASYSQTMAYDGSKYLVFAPWNADHITKFDVTTNTPTDYALPGVDEKFGSICFDGIDFWMAPAGYTKLVQFNADTGTITEHDDCPGDSTYLGFGGCAYNEANGKVYLTPGRYGKVVSFTSPNYTPPATGDGGGSAVGPFWSF